MLFNNEENPDVDFPYASGASNDNASLADSSLLTDTAIFGADTLRAEDESLGKKQDNSIDENASLADSSVMSSTTVSISPALQRYLATSSSLSSLPGSINKSTRKFFKVLLVDINPSC